MSKSIGNEMVRILIGSIGTESGGCIIESNVTEFLEFIRIYD